MSTATSGQPPIAGERAPEFTLVSTSGQTVTLESYLGQRHILLAFFPLAFTSTCTTELCAFTDDFDAFTGKGVTILPISVDSTASLKEYRAKYGMKADLFSDFKREVSRTYGVLLADKFYSARAYFLIDRDGVVRWSFVEAKTGFRRENSEILAEIAKLEH